MSQPSAPNGQPPAYGPSPQPANRRPERPWRTEGLPHGQGDEGKSRRPPWLRVAVALLVSYGVVFALLSWQDVSGGPATIPYTAFTEQVRARNVADVYARGETIQGTLRQARPVPGRAQGMLHTVDDEIRRISDDCYAEAVRLLRENRDRLDAIVERLLAQETLDEPEIYAAASIPRPAEPQPVTTAHA